MTVKGQQLGPIKTHFLWNKQHSSSMEAEPGARQQNQMKGNSGQKLGHFPQSEISQDVAPSLRGRGLIPLLGALKTGQNKVLQKRLEGTILLGPHSAHDSLGILGHPLFRARQQAGYLPPHENISRLPGHRNNLENVSREEPLQRCLPESPGSLKQTEV